MQAEINVPIVLTLFIVALMCIPNQDYVTASFTGEALTGEVTEKFIGKVSLYKPYGQPINGVGHLEPGDGSEARITFEITDNVLTITLHDGTTFEEKMDPFAKVYSTTDFMLQANRLLLGGRGEKAIVQKIPGYTMQTLHEKGGGQIQVLESEGEGGAAFARAAHWTIDAGYAVHVTFESVSFDPASAGQ